MPGPDFQYYSGIGANNHNAFTGGSFGPLSSAPILAKLFEDPDERERKI